MMFPNKSLDSSSLYFENYAVHCSYICEQLDEPNSQLFSAHLTGDPLTMTAGALTGETGRCDSPNKSGMFRHKRWSSSEAQTMKQMKRLGVSQTSIAQESVHSG